MDTVELRYKPLRLDDEFYEFCRENDQLKIERDSEGTIYIISNSGGTTGILNSIIKLLADALAPCEEFGPCF